MEPNEWNEFIDSVKANVRPHAGFFSWQTDRSLEELSVVQTFHESLTHTGTAFFHSHQSRGTGNDPPDCEAKTSSGGRIGIEVTELVDGASIAAAKSGKPVLYEPYSEIELIQLLSERIKKKDNTFEVKGGPYDEYVLIIFCDEPRVLDYELIQCVQKTIFTRTTLINRAFLLLSYSPWEKYCPFIELNLKGD